MRVLLVFCLVQFAAAAAATPRNNPVLKRPIGPVVDTPYPLPPKKPGPR